MSEYKESSNFIIPHDAWVKQSWLPGNQSLHLNQLHETETPEEESTADTPAETTA